MGQDHHSEIWRCPCYLGSDATDAEQFLPEAKKALSKAGNPDFEIVTRPKLNHLSQHATTGALCEYARIEETLTTEALDAMTAFVRKRFAEYPTELALTATGTPRS